jgi:hypothetical protein
VFRLPWLPILTSAQLMAASNPVNAGQPEAIPWFLYSTKTYTDNSTTRLTFFDSVENDKTLSNMETAGALPDPQFMIVHYVTCDILREPTTAAGGVDGAINDIELLLKATGRAIFTFKMSNKDYGPFPLTLCHSTGGATGVVAGTFTAEEQIQQANNGIPGSGGFPFGGALVIPPKVGFSVVLEVAAAVNLTADVRIRMGLAGVLYRRVL